MFCMSQGIPCAWNSFPAQQGSPWGGMFDQQQAPPGQQQQPQASGQGQNQNATPTWGYYPGRGWILAPNALEAGFQGMEPAQYCWNAERGWIIYNYGQPGPQ